MFHRKCYLLGILYDKRSVVSYVKWQHLRNFKNHVKTSATHIQNKARFSWELP